MNDMSNIMPLVATSNGSTYRICARTIMDTTDPNIKFNALGESDYCENFDRNILPSWRTDEEGLRQLEKVAAKIRQSSGLEGHNCIIGISGGLDSSYTAYVAKEIMGLRPLLLHVDGGWNTDVASANVERIARGLELELYAETIDWSEMRDFQVAFLKSQIPDQDLPQDTAFFSALYRFARKNRIRYVLTGGNYSTECCREPEEWGAYPGIDRRLIMDIHRQFGLRPLQNFPIVDILMYRLYYRYVLGMRVFKPLNYVPYIKKDAERLLNERFGWEPFQHKHHESRFTRFYEDYWLPRKFGFEKRRAHFSSLILTGQMTRDEALDRISRPELSEEQLQEEFRYVAHRLGLTEEELQEIFDGPNKTYRDYKNKKWLIDLGANVLRRLGLEKRLFR